MSNSTHGNSTEDWDYNRKADASSRQRMSTTSAKAQDTTKCQYGRLSAGGKTNGKD